MDFHKTGNHSHWIGHELLGALLVSMIQERQVERTLFHLVEFQLSTRGNQELLYHHLPYQNDNLQIENRVERFFCNNISSLRTKKNKAIVNRTEEEVDIGKPLLSADGIFLTFASSWSIVVADISRTARSPICRSLNFVSHQRNITSRRTVFNGILKLN